MGGRGASIGGTGTVTLYHSTNPAAADNIVRNGFTPTYTDSTRVGMAQSYKDTQGQYGFFTRRPGAQGGYGPAIISVTVPKAAVQRDKWSGHWKVPLAKLKGATFKRKQ